MSAPLHFEPGQNVAGYQILRHEGSGGMASLYLAARHGAAGFRKLVAIKVIHSHLMNDAGFVSMFLDEARLASRIQHPNVVHVEELLEFGGSYLMVMEYVHGCSLFDLLRTLAQEGRRLSPDLVAYIGAQIADGLHAAHELRDGSGRILDVVHRDVSPQNVLLSSAGHVKVIDFGIAKSKSQVNQTRAGTLRGKVGYMAPEQARGLPVDRRTDLYALGIVLWEMATSRRLFRGNSDFEVLDMVRDPNVQPPSAFADCPAPLEKTVMFALAPDPARRFQSGKDFRESLLRAQPGAASIHSSSLAALLEAVMGDAISSAEIFIDRVSLDQANTSRAFKELTISGARDYFTEEISAEAVPVPPVPRPTPPRNAPRPVSVAPPPPRPSPPPARPAANTFSQFTTPEMVTEKLPAQPSGTSSSIIVTILSITVMIIALGMTGYLLYQEGAFDDAPASAPANTP